MKKFISIVLVLMMVLSFASALADNYEVSESNLVFIDSNKEFVVTGKIKNTSSKPIELNYDSRIILLNGEEELFEYKWVYIYPKQIAAGETGYYTANIFYSNFEDLDKVKTANDVRLDLYFSHPNEKFYNYKTEIVTGEIERYGRMVPLTTAIIENDSDETKLYMEIVTIYQDKEGKLLYDNKYNSYLGFQAGNKIEYYDTIDSYKVEKLAEVGFDIDVEKTIIFAYSNQDF